MALNAKLHIETALRNEKTILKNSFCTPPFKIADITENKKQHHLQLMLMSSSPGILDGDEYQLQIDVAEKCSLELQTQAYQRLFRMKYGAKQSFNLGMKKNASFRFIPHPLVPHDGSAFFSMNKIEMDESCSLLWSEVMSCGRKINGEVFRFSSYHNCTEIFFSEKLVVKENILMRPALVDPGHMGQLEGYTHQSSLIFIDAAVNVTEKNEAIAGMLQQQSNIAYGLSALPVNGTIIRLLGYNAEQLFDLLKNISTLLLHKTTKETIYVAGTGGR